MVCNVASCWPAMLHPFLHGVYAPINVNPVGGGGGVRARGEDLMPETIPLSGF